MNQFRVSKGTSSFNQFQRAGGLYGKTQLKRVALDHCGAEITVELNPLDTKAKEAVKLTGGFLSLKWTAASKTSLKSSLCFCLHFPSLTLTTAATERTPSTLH